MLTLPHVPAHLEVVVVPLDDHRQRVALFIPELPRDATPHFTAPDATPIDVADDLFAQLARPFPGGTPPPPKGPGGWFGRFRSAPRAVTIAFEHTRPAPNQLLVPAAIDGHTTRPMPIALYVAAPAAHDFTLTEPGDDRPRPLDHFPEGLGHLRFRDVDAYTAPGDAFVPAGLVVDATFLRKHEPNTDLVLTFVPR